MVNYPVLFLGRANAGRTLMAEALVSRCGAPGLDDFLLRQRAQDVAHEAGPSALARM